MPNLSAEAHRIRRNKRIEQAKAMLGGRCNICSSTERLEFDHIEMDSKSYNISDEIARKSWEDLLLELKKCQLLCKECHKKKTLEECYGYVSGPILCKYCGKSLSQRMSYCDKRCAALNRWDQQGRSKHGTKGRYNRGCRCEDCRQAQVISMRKYRDKQDHIIREGRQGGDI